MYNSILNYLLVSYSQFAVGTVAYLDPRPRNYTPAQNPLAPRLSVSLLVKFGVKSIVHSFDRRKTLYWKRKKINCRSSIPHDLRLPTLPVVREPWLPP